MNAYRESASLIIAAKNVLKNTPSAYDYSLLLLKRQSKQKNFAGAFVFPGGIIESADADLKWEKLYKDHGFDQSCFKSLYPNTTYRPKIFRKVLNEIPREISLRISAIRETFEECGILICEKSGLYNKSKTANHLSSIPNNELEIWQHKVHNNADEFYNMCREYNCYPNVWALYEWGNWMTPTFFPANMRFNAAFFFTGLPHIPESILETGEMEELIWEYPNQMMESHFRSLLPPQQYEITRIAHHEKLDDLIEYAVKKSREGVQMFLSVMVQLSDGTVAVLPGDTMYPEKVEYDKRQIIDRSTMTIEELRNNSPKKHRIERPNNPKVKNTVTCKL